MNTIKLYIDTSIIGAIYDIEDQDRVDTTKKLLDMIKNREYDGYISDIVLLEIYSAPEKIKSGLVQVIEEDNFKILEETKESLELVNEYGLDEIFPKGSRDDSRHIAIAVTNDMDAVVSWNFKHMVNITKKKMINAVNLRSGCKQIDIVSPYEVIDYE